MRWLLVMAAIAELFVVGCDNHLPTDRPAASMPAVAAGSAEEVARTWLLLSQTLLRARAHHDTATAQRAAAELHRLLILPERLQASGTREEVINRIEDMTVDNWCAAIAYYTEGYDFDALRIEPPLVANGPTGVLIPARGKTDRAVIAVTCKGSDQGWRVSAINLLPESAIAGLPAPAGGKPVSSAPTKAPTSASAPASRP